MRVHLLFRDRGFEPASSENLSVHDADLVRDLELETLFDAMSGGDKLVYEITRAALMQSLADPEAIAYRQAVLRDCIAFPAAIRELYAVSTEALRSERSIFKGLLSSPSSILGSSVRSLELLVPQLRRLRQIADEHRESVRSEGMTAFFAMVQTELDDEYFQEIEQHLKRLEFRSGALLSVGFSIDSSKAEYVLRMPPAVKWNWKQLLGFASRQSYSFQIDPRDEAGSRALAALRDQGINPVANALAQSTDHIRDFFSRLQAESAFYVGCLNLRDRLVGKGEPTCMPELRAESPFAFSCRGLCDVSLSLGLQERVVGNDVDADGTSLVMVTGANSGGKSTFLRSVGQAQLMLQCGMFVGAQSYRASVCERLFTHFIREEDETMTSGRFDEELSRMSAIVDRVRPGSLVLFNESFAATNEREGSEIARQIVSALLEAGIRVVYVTHLFDLARSFFEPHAPSTLFLRAEREADGRRTFRVVPGAPLATSFGQDLFERMGGWGPMPEGGTVARAGDADAGPPLSTT